MKLAYFIFFLVIIANTAWSQSTMSEDTKKAIDEQIWQNFTKAYFEGDAGLFNDLHTDDVLRITRNGILKAEVYKSRNAAWMKPAEKGKRKIEFRFEHRLHNEDIAYEVGYYRLTSSSEDGDRVFYGRFHVLLKKIDGKWKIAQDWDTNNVNGHEVGEEDWHRLSPDAE